MGLFVVLGFTTAACGGEDTGVPSEQSGEQDVVPLTSPPTDDAQVFLEKQELTVLDQRITYPKKKPARISSETIVLDPGAETGWRNHRIPVYVHVLSGTYTVVYGEGALVEYPAGSAFVQAMKTDYNGMNTGEEPANILHVYLGAKGLRDVIER